MKKLFVILIFTVLSHIVSAQHYGGINISPYMTVYNTFYNGKFLSPGYSVGYQGLIMPQRRFSFSYGLQYGKYYNKALYDPPTYRYSAGQLISTDLGESIDIESIEIPLWWRYNILKNRKKFQPFIAVSTTVVYNLKARRTIYYLDNPDKVYEFNEGIGLIIDLGIGVNYYTDNWLFTIQPTYGYNYVRKMGIGFSVMKKF